MKKFAPTIHHRFEKAHFYTYTYTNHVDEINAVSHFRIRQGSQPREI